MEIEYSKNFQEKFAPQILEECKKINLETIKEIYCRLNLLTTWYHVDMKIGYVRPIDYHLCYNDTKLAVSYNPKAILYLLHDVSLCNDCEKVLIRACIKDDECYFCNNFQNYNIYSA